LRPLTAAGVSEQVTPSPATPDIQHAAGSQHMQMSASASAGELTCSLKQVQHYTCSNHFNEFSHALSTVE